MPIWLAINPRSGVPLYLQLVEQFRRALEVGILRPGDALPTVRQLARDAAALEVDANDLRAWLDAALRDSFVSPLLACRR